MGAPKRSRLVFSGLLDMRIIHAWCSYVVCAAEDIAAAQISFSLSYPEVSMCHLIRFACMPTYHAMMSSLADACQLRRACWSGKLPFPLYTIWPYKNWQQFYSSFCTSSWTGD